MLRKYPKMSSSTRIPLWHRFDSVRTRETRGDRELVLNNHVSLSIPAPCTHRDVIEKIASQSQRPIAIQSLADDLSRTKFVRGKAIFGFAGDKIDQIAANYEGTHWWISEEGLNIAIVSPAATKLSRFDKFAGKLYIDKWKHGKLSKVVLAVIAKKLDVARFTLKEELQPGQWNLIAEYNQRNPRQPIKTFEKACVHRMSSRAFRRRLYVARERYIKAISHVSSLSSVS
jgi:hypothetical protein